MDTKSNVLVRIDESDCDRGLRLVCVGDDIAWMHVDDEGRLRAINPEYGFFGVAPGTSKSTNPIALGRREDHNPHLFFDTMIFSY